MAKEVIMPALGVAQETGRVVQWYRQPGEPVRQGEPLLEIETDKTTVDVEAPASGVLAQVRAGAGADVPVGQPIALILAPGEQPPAASPAAPPVLASPVARRMAAEHHLDLSLLKPAGGRIESHDVQAYLARAQEAARPSPRPLASPKARRLAAEAGLDLARLPGSGPGGAVLAADVLAAGTASQAANLTSQPPGAQPDSISSVWRLMAERTSHSWSSAPHFYLVREVNATRLVAWHAHLRRQTGAKISYTDLLVRLVAASLRQHPQLNASWQNGSLVRHPGIGIGIAVAIEDGLIVPVIHRADELSLQQIADRRSALVEAARARRLLPEDVRGGTFSISNLGMYGVDAFNAIINTPQAAILAVGRIAERVVPVDGRIAIQPMLVLTLSCDHRVVDGARAARFLATLADLIEEPLALVS